MKRNRLLLEQLDNKMDSISSLRNVVMPPSGWINTIRTALNMSLRQLAERLNITIQSVKGLEQREQEGTITLNSLGDVAKALDMKLIYGFLPLDSSLEQIIEKKAEKLAKEIVLRTSINMKLEDQEVSKELIEKAIKERTEELKKEMPRILWD
jgi:predicted DNA-binding mobile mystery protein A